MSEWHSKPITSTGFDAQMCGDDGYEIHFYTDKKEAYLAVQDVCRQFIDRKPLRNADRIRNMDDYDLAIFLENVSCKYADTESWLDWLKQEVET